MHTVADRRRAFRELHASGCFVMPNPWDVGSAQALAHLGFAALATTSAGFAWSIGRRDNHITLDDALGHLRLIARSVELPLNADFEDGFAKRPEDVAANVSRAVDTGVAGLSIEDSTGDAASPLFDAALAVERVRAARRAIDDSGGGVILTGRSEGFIVGRPDLEETIRRLTAYADAGADCLYAPGVTDLRDITAIVKAVAPRPVNVLARPSHSVAEIAAAGVRRISVGGALARVAWSGFLEAAREITQQGTFTAVGRGVPSEQIEGLFEMDPAADRRR